MNAVHPRVAAALAGVAHRVRRHADHPGPIRSPADFAAALGYPLGRITKTLLVRVPRTERYAVVVVPVTTRVDLRRIAAELGAARVELAPADAPMRLLGYPPGAVSPLGVAGLPVFAGAALWTEPTVLVGGGAAGVEVELTPDDLLAASGAHRLPDPEGA
jgi:Cys-tRNA(Pro)/Cys-tRNA(Cys) deacylase